MIVTIVGPASCLTNAVIDACLRFLRGYVGETKLVTSNDIAELSNDLNSATQLHVLFHCPEPSIDVVLAFKRASIPVAIVLDDPYAHLAYMADSLGKPWHSAFRDYMRLMCLVQPVITDPYFALLRRDGVEAELVAWLGRLFCAQVSHEEAAGFVSAVFSLNPCVVEMPEGRRQISSPEAFRTALTPNERNEIEMALTDYLPSLERRRIEKITWRRQFFSNSELPYGANDIRIDTTGKARHLIFGPFFYIPSGSWRAVLRFALENTLSGCDLVFDVFDIGRNEILFEGELKTSPKRGAFACEFEFPITNATSPMEMRVFMKSGSIEGFFVFGDVDLHRVDSPEP